MRPSISGHVHGLTALLTPSLIVSRRLDRLTAQATPPATPDPPPGVAPELEEHPDLSALDAAWSAALAAILATWMAQVVPDWTQALHPEVAATLADNDLTRLASLPVDFSDGADRLSTAMTNHAGTVADLAVEEAGRQDVTVRPVVPARAQVSSTAAGVTAMMAGSVALTAGAEALRIWTPGASPNRVADQVDDFLDDLSDSRFAAALGWALCDVATATRLATFGTGPPADLYADEQLDGNTCGPCRDINGTWLGATDDPDSATPQLYPTGIYIGCEGGIRCRGTVAPVFRRDES